ncbi:uncharacterized protein WM294_006075 [Sarcoramphus papa]
MHQVTAACTPLNGSEALWLVLYKGEALLGIPGGAKLAVDIDSLLLGRALCFPVHELICNANKWSATALRLREQPQCVQQQNKKLGKWRAVPYLSTMHTTTSFSQCHHRLCCQLCPLLHPSSIAKQGYKWI